MSARNGAPDRYIIIKFIEVFCFMKITRKYCIIVDDAAQTHAQEKRACSSRPSFNRFTGNREIPAFRFSSDTINSVPPPCSIKRNTPGIIILINIRLSIDAHYRTTAGLLNATRTAPWPVFKFQIARPGFHEQPGKTPTGKNLFSVVDIARTLLIPKFPHIYCH